MHEREQWLRAAGECFGARAYQDVTEADLAAAAGLPVSSLRRYFADKPALYTASCREILGALEEELQAGIDRMVLENRMSEDALTGPAERAARKYPRLALSLLDAGAADPGLRAALADTAQAMRDMALGYAKLCVRIALVQSPAREPELRRIDCAAVAAGALDRLKAAARTEATVTRA